jgi:hypothetical protein
MKNIIHKILPYFLVTGFILYWLNIFVLSMPDNSVKNVFKKASPGLNLLFGNSWKFFSPSFTYNNRLYYVLRDIAHPANADTIEVLENMIRQKQLKAPFNQAENIIDHLLHHDAARMTRAVWNNRTKPSENEPGTTDSAYIAKAVTAAAGNINFMSSKASLLNYANILVKERKIDTTGKEISIIITEQPICPFKYLTDTSLTQKEITCVETVFNRFKNGN